MAKIFIDNKPYEVRDGQNLLQACLELGINLPYFCWHPAMGSVGACRQCAVKVFRNDQDQKGRIVMACMTPASDGTRLSVFDPEAHEFRASVTEWMMTNHPHDCPICDEGGECHLQDMTVMTGHAYRRYRGKKRTFNNQNLGPFVNHEMNRCIQCYRCVRFYRDYAGGRDFDAFELRDIVYFGRKENGVLESEFSGNLVEVCPTGVFTDKSLKKHYTRKWDLQTGPSICVNCSLGCNTIPGERYGLLRRIRNRYNGEVNGYFLCDRGRYGYEFVNSDQRIIHPQMAHSSSPASKAEALRYLGELLSGGAKLIGIGSPRASLEANFALRTLVGPDHFYRGVSAGEASLTSRVLSIMQNGPARSPSLHEVGECDAVLVLGEDVTNTAPMLALALRQSVRQQPLKHAEQQHIPLWDDASVRELLQKEKGPLYMATLANTRLDDVATQTIHAAPDELARLGFAVAHEIDSSLPAVTDLSSEMQDLVKKIADTLKAAEKPLVVSGTSCGSEAIIQAAANVAWALCANGKVAELSFVVPEANSLGLAMIGGDSLDAAIKTIKDGKADTVIILENDLYRRADSAVVDELFNLARHVIVIDYLTNPTVIKAEVVLPAAPFAECDGTLVNNEGRAQRFYSIMVPKDDVQASWRYLCDIMAIAGRTESNGWQTQDDMVAAVAQGLAIFKPILQIAPPAGFRIGGLKVPRQPARYSGRTSMRANINVSEPKPPDDPDTPLSYSMEGTELQPPAALLSRFWAPGWNSIQSLNKFQEEIGGPLRGGDAGVRLIEPAANVKITYYKEIPPAFSERKGEWLVVPLYHIYGSEELSVLSPGVVERAPQPYLGLNPADMAALKIGDGEILELEINGVPYQLPARSMPGLAKGLAGMPVGLVGLHGVGIPARSKLVPLPQTVEGANK